MRLKPRVITTMECPHFSKPALVQKYVGLENAMSECRTTSGIGSAILRTPIKGKKKNFEVAEERLDFVGILNMKDRLAAFPMVSAPGRMGPALATQKTAVIGRTCGRVKPS